MVVPQRQSNTNVLRFCFLPHLKLNNNLKLKFKLACLICIFAIPVILSSCKESIDIEEIVAPNLNQAIKPPDKEIEDFKNWYSKLNSNPNARIGAKDEMDEVQEIELCKRAKIHQQDKSSSSIDINSLANNINQIAKNGQLWTLGGSNCIHQVSF